MLGMCNRTEDERRRQTLCDKFSLKKLFVKEINGFMLNVSFFKRPENINVKFTTNKQLIALSRLSHKRFTVLFSLSSCYVNSLISAEENGWATIRGRRLTG